MTVDVQWCATHLRSCDGRRRIQQGRQLHQLLLKSGLAASIFAANCLLQMYTRCSPGLHDARRLFDEMSHRNCFSWNSLIDASIDSGDSTASLQLFHAMPEKNEYSWNAIITGLIKLSDLSNARKLFDEMPTKHRIALNAVLHGHFRSGRVHDAFNVYKRLNSSMAGKSSPSLDTFVLATVISACADLKSLSLGRQIHSQIIVNQVDLDAVLGSALVDMYGKSEDLNSARSVLNTKMESNEFSVSALITAFSKCGRLNEARRLFDSRHEPGIALWNSMINGYASCGRVEEALIFFRIMMKNRVNPDSSTFATVLCVCARLALIRNVVQIHAGVLKHGASTDIFVGSALVDSYSKAGYWNDAFAAFREFEFADTVLLNSMINAHSAHGRIEEARRLFDQIEDKSLISWNSMVVGYNQNGFAAEALELFSEMHELGIELDNVALASAISASASLNSLVIGEQIFSLATTYGLASDQIIATSLVDFYCKCGCVFEGAKIFEAMGKKFDEAAWNSMLMGYASNGMGGEVLRLFDGMRNATGVTPGAVTFIAILSACCHCGLVEEGLGWFDRMKKEYGIRPLVEHYSCVVDLLVRAGRVEDAVLFIDCMPGDGEAGMWTAVLGGCRAGGNRLIGEKAAERIMELCPGQPGAYLQISSICAANGDWNGSERVRSIIQERKMKKYPGFSWINR
ncbi:putative pentatricopeptide repeat-containing protein [Platanthera zijinensis]|uniref:Pentatricopeptide repeat-containing protein n=1 Tax=Platanthera zijinensis TaxID=2320716 RepID=A0AAP0GE58_9ASPA